MPRASDARRNAPRGADGVEPSSNNRAAPVATWLAPDVPPRAGAKGRLVGMWTTVGGRRVYARVSSEPLPPDAPTMVLVHGVAVSHRYLMPLARRLAPHARVYVPDLPGYGRSDKPPLRELTVPDLADWLLAWMDALGLERPHLIGNSFGCQVVADLAARHPDRAGRVVLLGPTMDPNRRTALRQTLRWLVSGLFEDTSETLVLLRDFLDIGPRRLVGMVGMGLHDPIERKLPRVTAPTLVVRGSLDALVPQDWAAEATHLLPNGRLVVVRGAAHTIHYSQPAWLLDTIWRFLGGEDADGQDADGTALARPARSGRHADGRGVTMEQANSGQPDPRRAEPGQPDGSEPGGGAGMENIERSAGVGTDRETTTERGVEEMAAGEGDAPQTGPNRG